ncbi:MAG: 3-deoxy-7-phosphoheptulonate synthase [Treponema sp.]|nr:3-deoxy-7-phosphoheptulonate synthase [Treponema sp.]
MIIVLKPNLDEAQYENLIVWLKNMNLELHESTGVYSRIIGLVGDTSAVDTDLIGAMEIVESVKRIDEPYKAANRKYHPLDTVVEIGSGGVKIGGGHFCTIAGPCSVETEEQICGIARDIKSIGAKMLRGGAFKPRTSPYSFQGLGGDGLELLLKARVETGLPIVTEIMDLSQLSLFENIDVIQVGARNMQNFQMLKELGRVRKPILLKRGLSNTIEEWLMSAEYIMAGGNGDVILCERGIRTFETATRNTLDLSAIPVVKELSHLPIIVDPSHATGHAKYVETMSMAAVAAGADGLIIEVHNNPTAAWCDGQQSLTPEAFRRLSEKIDALRKGMGVA